MNRYSKYSEKAALNNRVFNVKVLIIGTFNQKKALEGAFSVIVKLQTSRRFVYSFIGHWQWSPQLCTVSSRKAALSFCPQFKWKQWARQCLCAMCGGPNQAFCMAHSEIEWICSHLSHILEKSGFLRH